VLVFQHDAGKPTQRYAVTRYLQLSRRERQVMDILYRESRPTAARIRALMPDPPSYSAVRAVLRTLEEKGCVRHEEERLRYVYLPAVPRDKAQGTALGHLVRTFFGGSAEAAVVALVSDPDFSRAELDRLAQVIDKRRKEGQR
jgi:BlaI family transcriptional regulator, penicillinase repressor